MMQLKEKIQLAFKNLLEDKIRMVEKNLQDLFESGKNETKSTAGDKHETALAMLQIEQANLRRQMAEFNEQLAVLNSIDPLKIPIDIRKGSLVRTDKGYLYLAVGLGKISVEDQVITSVSLQSPLGQKLLGQSVGGVVLMNQAEYKIEALF